MTPTSFGSARYRGDEQITEVYQMQHGSVREIVPILKPLLPPTSHFAAHAPTNTVIITDDMAFAVEGKELYGYSLKDGKSLWQEKLVA